MEFVMYRPTPSSGGWHKEPISSPSLGRSGLATASSYLLENREGDDLLSDDEFPSVSEIFPRRPVRRPPVLIDLTLDSSDEVST